MGQLLDKAQMAMANGVTDSDAMKPPASIRPIGKIRPIDLEGEARGTRVLNRKERGGVAKDFGGSLDPSTVRVGYDFGMQGTNLKAYVDPMEAPNTVRMDPSKGEVADQDSWKHELVHLWQNQTGRNEVGGPYEYGGWPALKKAGGNLDAFGSEQQAQIIRDALKAGPDDPVFAPYIEFLKKHPSRPLPDGTDAFVDSLRQRLGLDAEDDIGPRLESVNGKSMVVRRRH